MLWSIRLKRYLHHAISQITITTEIKTFACTAIQREYERAGARYEYRDGWWIRTFTLEALKTFYLRDVLMHELGHHMDHHNRKYRYKEKFAEWFATEYGYKRRKTL